MVAFAEEKGIISPLPRISREDYLQWEVQQEEKHEYHDGRIIKMAGANPDHFQIASNLNGQIYICLRGTPCRVFGSDARVFIPECNKYYYPDLTVVCNAPEYENIKGIRSLLNPSLIIEVLSPSTAKSDRIDKFDCYKTLASLQTYVLTAQDAARMQVFERQEADEWIEMIYAGRETTAKLERIGCALTLADVYEFVTFNEAQTT